MPKIAVRPLMFHVFLCCCALTVPLHAQSIEVNDAWVRGTVAAQTATGAFMEITSRETAVLTGVSSPLAASVEVHEMHMDGDVMKMRALEKLELPAGKTVKLGPGGYHLMLLGLKRPLQPGMTVPLSLEIQTRDGKRSRVRIEAEVRNPGAARQP